MSITVKSQAELDGIPLDTDEQIYIEFDNHFAPAIVRNKYRYSVVARENSSVEAWGNSSVVARGNSSVVAWGNSSVVAWENSSVEAWGNSSVVAWENSSVVAWENSSVVARGNSSVVAWGNSSVEAWGNSSVEAWGNVQIVDRQLSGGRIQMSGNARKVYMPKNIEEFMNFYGIKHDKTTAVFYKAVHKVDNEFISNYDKGFRYTIGDKVAETHCSTEVTDDCGKGIHISHLAWALDFGRNWSNLAILELEVKIKDIIVPINTDGKVRVPEAKVLREVPLSECGLFGKILERRRTG
ncbi:hypothetical protein [uncultured Ruminococcus sp.]|uniref:hypothetical protein n=1 Tax=uncultured Ruminococcus sp. TaxID=165186 RepID=UPI0025F14D1A|nr:hypothetical protein [uncultured Ruminococcus sp.]